MRQIDDYRAKHPELKSLLQDFLMETFLEKPESVQIFAKEYFSKFLKPQRGLIISGPSGVGKGTVIQKIREIFPEAFGFSISHTSRNPRPGEEEGVHYYFGKKEEIQKAIDDDLFLESADVFGNLYGTRYTLYK